MEAFIAYEIDLEVKATQAEKSEFCLMMLKFLTKAVGKGFVDALPENLRKFYKIANHEGSAKEV